MVWTVVAAIAYLQHGLVARWQLRFLGLSNNAIQARVDRHGWRVIYPGVYAVPGVRLSPLTRGAAALLAYSQPVSAASRAQALLDQGVPPVDALVGAAFGPWAVLSGRFAAYLVDLVTVEPAWVDVTLRPGASLAAKRGVRLSFMPLSENEIEYRQRLPVVTAERAIADVAGSITPWRRAAAEVARLVATADARRITDVDRVDSAVAARGSFNGRPALEHAIAGLRGALSHSATEAWARRKATAIANRYGLSVHPRPYPIMLDGRQVAEADIAVVEIRYDLEIDGPHHLLPAQAAKDKRRDRQAQRAQWTVDRHLVTDIDADRRAFLAEVDARIRQLKALNGASRP